MIRRSFFGYLAAKLPYETVEGGLPDPVDTGLPGAITLQIQIRADQKPLIDKKKTLLKKGVDVQRGAVYGLFDEEGKDLIAPASGTVTAVETRTGNYGRLFALIHINTTEEGEASTAFAEALEKDETSQETLSFLALLPELEELSQAGNEKIHTVILSAMEEDLFINVNQYAFKARKADFTRGAKYIAKVMPRAKVVLALPDYLKAEASDTDIETVGVKNLYPSGNKMLLAGSITGNAITAGKTPAEEGVLSFNTEAVALLGKALRTASLPMETLISVRMKDKETRMVSARVGTPISHIYETLNVTLEEKDHLIMGGPLTGTSVYGHDFPVYGDTDGLICHGQENMPRLSDSFCINCGKCVRLCPAGIPVNLLVRVLENELYEEAVEKFDLDACVECGLCSFICVAKMPLFQRIMLARHTLAENKKSAEKGGA